MLTWHDRLYRKLVHFIPSLKPVIIVVLLIQKSKICVSGLVLVVYYNLRDNNAALNILDEGLRILQQPSVRRML